MWLICVSLIILCHHCDSFTKVLVPSVYDEWDRSIPEWISNEEIKQKYGYSVFLYQKKDPTKPNYIATNRGRENGVYYRYIVDHYLNFPDVAIFVHAHPHEHQPKFLELIGCINPKAKYISINHQRLYRNTRFWGKNELWVEQCMREVLKVTWNITSAELGKRLPADKPVSISFYCCQQFIISRQVVHQRPLHVWERLMHMLAEDDVCHSGEPEYEYLHAYNRTKKKVGPEPSKLPDYEWSTAAGTGRMTQAVTSEHLAHVIFGHYDVDMEWPTNTVLCENFLSSSACPASPCRS